MVERPITSSSRDGTTRSTPFSFIPSPAPPSVGPVLSNETRIETPPLSIDALPPDLHVLSPSPPESPPVPLAMPFQYDTCTPPTPLDLCCFSQNVNKSNTVQHVLLNDSLAGSRRRDLIFLQEPWYGKIGVDYERQSTESRDERQGTVNNSEWIVIPPIEGKAFDVVTYVRKNHEGWNVTMRPDLISHPSIQVIQVITDKEDALFINLYNPSDNSVAPLLSQIDLPSDSKIMITGDFNLHHADWSKEGQQCQAKAGALVDWMRANDFNLLNRPGEITWFRSASTNNPNRSHQHSVLDLTWSSTNALNSIADWGVRKDLHNGSDHLPITWRITLNKGYVPPSLPKYRTCDELQAPWAKEFRRILDTEWETYPEYFSNEEEFDRAVNSFHKALTEASNKVLAPRPTNPRPSFWYNSLCKEAVGKLRTKKKNETRAKKRGNPAEIHEARKELYTSTVHFKASIRKSKRLGAMEFANKVTHANVWRLNDWYRGKRRTYSPVLLAEDGSPKAHPKDKCDLMHESFFAPPKPIKGDFTWSGENERTRKFEHVVGF